jgi:glycerol-3-phosphate acyltransferase PlsY
LRRFFDLVDYRRIGGLEVDSEILGPPLLAFLLGYGLGSIPFGLILTRLAGAGDLRAIGSGNIGATNVLRTGRKDLAAATVLLDMAKGSVAILLAAWLWPPVVAIAAIGALLGHLWPVWLRFAGGKGVATYFGIVLGLALAGEASWAVPAAFAVLWLTVLALTRYSSASGLAAAAAVPVAAGLTGRFDLAILFLGLSLLVFWKHRANLGRLLAGTEPRVGSRA